MNLKLSAEVVIEITGADFHKSNEHSELSLINHVVIDSRSPRVGASTLFVLFKGNKVNAADFIGDFAENGGGYVVTPVKMENCPVHQFVVKEPLAALQQLAIYHRNRFNIPVIGITGSNGKTTVKEWLYHLLKADFNIVRSPKSYNSQIGVPLSVLEIQEEHDLAIFEAGISQYGEMTKLEKMIRPSIGVFTGLGDAHNNGFSGVDPLEEKRKEKFKLFDHSSTVILSKEDLLYIEKNKERSTYHLEYTNERFLLKSSTNAVTFDFPFSDKASASNAALATLVADQLGVKLDDLHSRLSTLPVISMRLEKILGRANNVIINDSYNLDEKSLNIGLTYAIRNGEGRDLVLIMAESEIRANDKSTLLHQVKLMPDIKEVYYIGPSNIAAQFSFIKKHYNSTEVFLKNPPELEDNVLLFAGSRSCKLERAVNIYLEKKHITRLEINLQFIRENLNYYRQATAADTRILAMVKAQSYGGGIREMAHFLTNEGVDYLGVAYTDEGVELRKAGIERPIIVMNPEPAAFDDLIAYRLEPSIYSADLLNEFIHRLILRQTENFPIHIKLETGMNRLGFEKEQLSELVAVLNTQPEVFVKSSFSHLSVADDLSEKAYTQMQIKDFKEMTTYLSEKLGYKFMRHLANSSGALNYPEAQFDMVRVGIGLFGLTGNLKHPLRSAVRLVSQLSQTRRLEKGESVGYGRMFKADKPTFMGVVPVGYADGLRRALSNGGWKVKIGEKYYPIIGNICMDMCMIDLGDDQLKRGVEVQLFGEGNSIYDMSNKLNTIPYEIISAISSRVQRIYYEE